MSAALTSARVLLLNATFEPLKIINWQKAMLLLISDKIEIVESYEVHLVRTPKVSFYLPSVIRLKEMIRRQALVAQQRVRFSRKHIFLRDAYCCQYCGERFNERELTMDHVIPVAQGGRKSWNNIVTSCVPCNQLKGSRTPNQAAMRLIRAPREPMLGFLPDLLYYQDALPSSWQNFLVRKSA